VNTRTDLIVDMSEHRAAAAREVIRIRDAGLKE
jgi:hypothetical protein